MNTDFIVDESYSGKLRLDVFISEKAEISRSRVQRAIIDGKIKVDQETTFDAYLDLH